MSDGSAGAGEGRLGLLGKGAGLYTSAGREMMLGV